MLAKAGRILLTSFWTIPSMGILTMEIVYFSAVVFHVNAYLFCVSVQLLWLFFGNKLSINLCALLGFTVEFMLNKGGDDLSDNRAKY